MKSSQPSLQLPIRTNTDRPIYSVVSTFYTRVSPFIFGDVLGFRYLQWVYEGADEAELL